MDSTSVSFAIENLVFFTLFLDWLSWSIINQVSRDTKPVFFLILFDDIQTDIMPQPGNLILSICVYVCVKIGFNCAAILVSWPPI